MGLDKAQGVNLMFSLPRGESTMENTINATGLALAIAEIAGATREPETAAKLLDLADQLLTQAGLSRLDEADQRLYAC